MAAPCALLLVGGVFVGSAFCSSRPFEGDGEAGLEKSGEKLCRLAMGGGWSYLGWI